MRIYFGPSYWRAVDYGHDVSRTNLLRLPADRLTYRPEWNDALIERSRSRAMTRFLEAEPNHDVLLTIDGDIIFRVQDAVRICQQALELGAIVGGVYVTRDRENCWPTSDWDGTIEFAGQVGEDDDPEPVKYVSAGFMAVPRCIPEALAERDDMPMCHDDREYRFRPFYQPFPIKNEAGKWIYLSEDFALCQRAREHGFGVFINPAVRVHHYGLWPFRLEDMAQKPLAQQPIAITGTVNPENGAPVWHTETLAELNPDPTPPRALNHAAVLVGPNGEPVRERKETPMLVVPAGGAGRPN